MTCLTCALNFKKTTFWRKLQKLAIFKLMPLSFGPMYVNETSHICKVVLYCYHEQIRKDLLEYFRRFCNLKFEKWEKHEKVVSFSSRGRKNLRIYSWYCLPDLKHDQKRFIRIPLSNFQKWGIRHVLANFVKRLPWKRWPSGKFRLHFWQCISKFYYCTEFHYHQMEGEKVINDQNFQVFCFRAP